MRTALRQRLLDISVRAIHNTPVHRLPSVPALMLFSFAWGNMGYGGTVRLLRHICRTMKRCEQNVILECGSGASTVLMGILAKRYNSTIIALENHEGWAQYMQAVIRDYKLDAVQVFHAPLCDYDSFSWYSVPDEVRVQCFSLVVCDGPPAATPGGRYGLLPVLGSCLTENCTVLLDDTNRAGERRTISQWKGMRALQTQYHFALKWFTEISFVRPSSACN
jgi:hypothetical protein